MDNRLVTGLPVYYGWVIDGEFHAALYRAADRPARPIQRIVKDCQSCLHLQHPIG
jgi:hypothetical protein